MGFQATKIANLMGEGGGIYITDTSAHTLTGTQMFCAILAHEATVIATATSPTVTGTLTTVAIPAGAVWYGRFTSITLTSGKVTAYYAI